MKARFYRTTRGWKWVVKARNGRVIDRADEPFSSKGAAARALKLKARILSDLVARAFLDIV